MHNENLEPYPHPDKWKNLLDRVIYVVGVMGPLMTLPQIYKIWIERTATGVSLLTWSSYLVVAIIWTFYGFVHKEKPIIFTNILWILVDIVVILGVIFYG